MATDFTENLMKMLAAQMHFFVAMTAAREMFGRSYFSLGQSEKIAVDQAVIGFVGNNYREITPEFLAGQEARQPAGFRAHEQAPPSGSS